MLKEQFVRMTDDRETVVTDITIYDTTRETDSITGKPPVRATISQTKQNRSTEHETRSGTKQKLSSVKEVDDVRAEATRTADEEKNREQKPASFGLTKRLCGLLFVVLGVAFECWLFKRKINK